MQARSLKSVQSFGNLSRLDPLKTFFKQGMDSVFPKYDPVV